MLADGAGLDMEFDKERGLFELANLYPRSTGLPVTVWVSPRGGAGQDARIKVCRMPGDRMDLDDVAIVAVQPSPSVLHGDLRPEIAGPVLAWAALNAEALVDYWDGTIDSAGLVDRLKTCRF